MNEHDSREQITLSMPWCPTFDGLVSTVLRCLGIEAANTGFLANGEGFWGSGMYNVSICRRGSFHDLHG
jgi:hypothetical protein